MTVVDYHHLTGNRPNTTLMLDVDREAFVRSARPAVSLLRLTFLYAGPLSPAEKGAC